MPRGGKRQGRQGKAYPRRTDLAQAPRQQPVGSFGGLGWGEQASLQQSQQAVPVAPPPPPGAGGQGAPMGPGGMLPGDVPGLADPTRNPEEPLTAGLPFGPGAGPEGMEPGQDELGMKLRALYLANPTQELRELLEEYDL